MFLVSTSFIALTATWLLATLAFSVQASLSGPATMLTATTIAKPHCQRKCGNLTIPYPFGVEKHCALGDEYIINCYTDDGITTPQFLDSTSQVLEISETQVTVAAGGPLAESCTNSAEKGENWGHLDLTGKPYALSSSGNKFMVTGCHHYGLIEANTRAGRQVFSCVALCTKKEDLLDRKCSGIGCCQVPLPKGLQRFKASMELINYKTNVTSGNCSYAFIVKRASFDFLGAADLKDQDFVNKLNNMPVVLDWFVANMSCRKARQNLTAFACKQNSICIDVDRALDVRGYRCKCVHGYEGNPYLSPGCTDFNDCASEPCAGICRNTPGSYTCHCPSGFRGDGRKDGSGCIPRSLRLIFILGFGIGLGTILFLLGGYWMLILERRRREVKQREKNFKRNGGLLLQQQLSAEEGMTEKTRFFNAKELEKATDVFNEDRILGRGGQGTVYKGMLSDGNLVAIKKHKLGSQSQLGEFINEIVLLSQTNHRNVVKLLGCCLEADVPLLVYEFIPNGTVSECIHVSTEEFPVTWEMRLQIALDVAGALTYLHSASSKPILHKDVKSSNVLLDAKYRAKLSDFGTSRSIAVDQTHLTTKVQGTFGYLDPEYFRTSHYTEKSDVYSFGVVLVELLTGKKAVVETDSSNGRSLISLFLSAMENSDLHSILATRVANEAKEASIFATANLAKQCLNTDGRQRPTMREVALELEVISHHHDTPVSFLKSPTEHTITEVSDSPRDGYFYPSCTFCGEELCTLHSY